MGLMESMSFTFLSALSIAAVAAAWVVPIGVLIYFGLRFMRAYERRSESANETRILKERMLRLEKRLSELGDDVRGIAEAQRFTSRRLMERETTVAGKVVPPVMGRPVPPVTGGGVQPHGD